MVSVYTIDRTCRLHAADDLEAAVAVASGCPSLARGGGVEVGMIAEASQRPRLAAAD
jgi:hypothetical protein